jgi:hypothetical protein
MKIIKGYEYRDGVRYIDELIVIIECFSRRIILLRYHGPETVSTRCHGKVSGLFLFGYRVTPELKFNWNEHEQRRLIKNRNSARNSQ